MRTTTRVAELTIVVAILTALVTWWTWGAVQPVPLVQDEQSYVLQAEIFARGRWTAPSPPVPSSFQQPHVLTTPGVASKYPPGHAMALAPGALVGAPWLVALLLAAVSGALVFRLIEAHGGVWIGLAGWAVWLSDPLGLRFRPGYYSEATSGLTWLVVWWCLSRWRGNRDRRWLLGVAAALGVNAITRPFSALALAVPVAAVVLAIVIRERKWRDLAWAVAVGAAIVAVLPLWSWRTVGTPFESPLATYRERYIPFDKPGFGLDSTPPSQPLSPLNAEVYAEFALEHARHTVSALPRIAVERARTLAIAEFGGWRAVLVPFVLLGAAVATAELWFAGACAAALFAAYLTYAHWSGWTLYYFEAIPVVAFFAAAGFALLARWSAARIASPRPRRVVATTLAVLLTVGVATNVQAWRGIHRDAARNDVAFRALVDSLPMRGAVIFVRYSPDYHPHTTIVANSASLETDRVWIVIDDPAKNVAVLRAAAGRTPLLFEERGGRLSLYRALVDSLSTTIR